LKSAQKVDLENISKVIFLIPFKNSQLEIGGQYLGKNTFLTLKTPFCAKNSF
jgi:hypothetical protein